MGLHEQAAINSSNNNADTEKCTVVEGNQLIQRFFYFLARIVKVTALVEVSLDGGGPNYRSFWLLTDGRGLYTVHKYNIVFYRFSMFSRYIASSK